jgi:uncharacterized protein
VNIRVKEKVVHIAGEEVHYSADQWQLFRDFRRISLKYVRLLHENGFNSLTYGSIARGNVKPTSDIDIVLKERFPSFQLELFLEEQGFRVLGRKIIQATPNDVIKANYLLEDEICITLLLTDFTSMPFEFYKFGGALDYSKMVTGIRVPGVDKRLVLIEPTEFGHRETALAECQHIAAKILGVSQKIIDQRVRVLTRRDKIGRTGVYLNVELHPDENVEESLRSIAKKNPMVRRRLNF